MRDNIIAQVQPDDMVQYRIVRVLRLGHNNISHMEANMCGNSSSLVQLDLNNNHIRSIPSEAFQNLHSLTELFLDSNDIDDLQADAFDGLGSLSNLILKDNDISEIPPGLFRDLKSLIKLNIANNNIAQITGQVLTGLFKLQQLNLQGNRITSVGPETFQSLTNLVKIELDGNQLVSLDATTFIRLPRLRELILNNNNLTSIKNTRLWLPKKASNLTTLALAGNPLHCNCDFEPIRVWYRNKDPQNEGAICASPSELKGRRLAAIAEPLCEEPVDGLTSPRVLTTVQERGPIGNVGGPQPREDTWKIVIVVCVTFLVVAIFVAASFIMRKQRQRKADSVSSSPQLPGDIERQPRERHTSTSPLMSNEEPYEIYTVPPDARGTPQTHMPNTTPSARQQRPQGLAPLVKQVSATSITTAQDILETPSAASDVSIPPVKPARQRQFSVNEPDIPELEIEFDSAGQVCFRQPSTPESIYESVKPRFSPAVGTTNAKSHHIGTNTGYLPLPNPPVQQV